MTSRFSRLAALLSCVTVVAHASLASAQTVTLRYRFAKGDVTAYQMTSKVETTLGGLPMGELKLNQTIVQTIEATVEDVTADGTATLRQTFKREKMEMTTPMGLIAYDSASTAPPASDPISGMLAAVFGSLIGESITVVMTSTGTVQKVEGMAKLLEKMSAKMPADPTGGMLTTSLKSLLDDDSIRSMYDQGFGHLPDHAVKPGDSWPGQLKIGTASTGRLAGSLTSTLTSIENGVARVAVTLTLTQDGPPAPGPMGMAMKLDSGKGDGEVSFDVDKGRMTRSATRNETHSSVSLNGPDGTPINATTVVVGTSTIEVLPK